MIVDSSAWIAHLRGTRSIAVRQLRLALGEGKAILLPDVVLMEVLRGARDPDHFLRVERALLTLSRFVPEDARLLARRAAHLYARCRWAGFTPRSGNDCVIACCALEAGKPVLHEDRDFQRIARVEPALRLVT